MSSNFDNLPICAIDADVTFSRATYSNKGARPGVAPIETKAMVKLAESPAHIRDGDNGEGRPRARTRFLFLGSGEPDAWPGWGLETGDLATFHGRTLSVVGSVFPTCKRRFGSDGVSYIYGWGVFAELVS